MNPSVDVGPSAMHVYMQPMKDWHIDLILKKMLTESWQSCEELGACYVVPPMGSFIEHESGCSKDRDTSRIQGMWDQPWCQEGTRKRTSEQKHRRLALFTSSGDMRYLTEDIALPEKLPLYRWLTEPIPEGLDVSLSPVLGLTGVWAEPEEEEEEPEAGGP